MTFFSHSWDIITLCLLFTSINCDSMSITYAAMNRTFKYPINKHSYYFHVQHIGVGSNDCGGCLVLRLLTKALNNMGYIGNDENDRYMCPDVYDDKIKDKKLIIVYPEGVSEGCSHIFDNVIHVHWILAAIGVSSRIGGILMILCLINSQNL